MASQTIQDLVNFKLSSNYVPLFKEGRFTLANSSVATLTSKQHAYQCDLSLATDFQLAGRKVRLDINPQSNDFTGYNKKYINEHGFYDPGLALSELSRYGFEKRIVKEDTYSLIQNMTQRDSHEMFLYNMLVSWLKAHLYKYEGRKDKKFTVKTSPYKDSHLTIPLDGDLHLGEHSYEIEVGPPIDIDDEDLELDFQRRRDTNYWRRPFVLHFNGGSKKQQAFYLCHVYGRTVTSALNVDIELPGLAPKEILLDVVNSGDEIIDLESDWTNPNLIWEWITDYVALNRLHQQFAAVLEVFSAIAAQPTFPTQESTHWNSAQLVAVLGLFSPTRARIRSNLEGEQFFTSPVAGSIMITEAATPINYIMNAAVYNYYMWYGLYAIMHNTAVSRSDWTTVFGSLADALSVLVTPAMRAACVSSITGKEVHTNQTYSAGFYVDTSTMGDDLYVRNAVRADGSRCAPIPIEALYAPVSGSLILGTLSGDLDVVQHIKAVQTLPHAEVFTQTLDHLEWLKIANAYRLFGHQCVFESEGSLTFREAWANAKHCVIEPASVHFSPTKPSRLYLNRSYAREGRSYPIMPAIELLRSGGGVLEISKPCIAPVEWQRWRKPLAVTVMTRRENRTKVQFQVGATFSAKPHTYTMQHYKQLVRKDFQVDQTEILPTIPEGEKTNRRGLLEDVACEETSAAAGRMEAVVGAEASDSRQLLLDATSGKSVGPSLALPVRPPEEPYTPSNLQEDTQGPKQYPVRPD
nr:capsid protein [Helianthus annus leaf-associated totivirus 7]